MATNLAVFRGTGDIAVICVVLSEGRDSLEVTDEIGLKDIESCGQTQRRLFMAKKIAYRYDKALVEEGQPADWGKLKRYGRHALQQVSR